MSLTVIKNAAQIVTFLGNKAKKGQEMNDMHIYEHAILLIENDKIAYVGHVESCPFSLENATIIDASNKLVMPGLVDSHTHLVFGKDRALEFYQRLNKQSYQEILRNGGGIHQSIENTTQASKEKLIEQASKYVKKMIAQGVTTLEAKSGYSKDFDGEVKQMEVVQELNYQFDNMIISTCLAAHVIPLAYKDNPVEYISMIKEKLIPYVQKHELATFFDAFLEENAYSAQQVIDVLTTAQKAGFKTKLHCDEINDFDGANIASQLGCISAEHLLVSNKAGILAMADKNVIATLLPLTALSLKKEYAKARQMIDAGCAVALASDFNPGSCFSYSMPLLMAISVMQMEMSMQEMICAITLNGAAALDVSTSTGTLEIGKQADVVLFDCPSFIHLVYHLGINQVSHVLKNGKTIFSKEKEEA